MNRVLPVLFNTEMVQAILAGRKTVTRRIVKKKSGKRTYAPYQPGDILYVRETWNYVYDMDGNDQIMEDTGRYVYYADDQMPFTHWVDTDTGEYKEFIPWRPSIHMPKEAARIFLKVTYVRADRLQEITEEQALAEGAIDNRGFIHSPENEHDDIHSAREHFKKIWDSTVRTPDINRRGWDANPLVWAIEFERCEKPESW